MIIYILKMNVWWENFSTWDLLAIIIPIVVAIVLVRKE